MAEQYLLDAVSSRDYVLFQDMIPSTDHEIEALIMAAFLEMPGLSLTIAQATRLHSIDRDRCVSLLEGLVRQGRLRVTLGGRYVLAGPQP